jgi:hypothetical protein
MHNITHISEVDRKRLIVLNDAARECETSEELQKVREEITAIEDTRKPLSACNLSECTELRTAIWDKFDRLNRAGKYSIAQQFKVMLRQIEIHQSIITRQAAMEDAQRKLADKDDKERLVSKVNEKLKANREESEDTSKPQSFSSRWTTGIGSLD